MIVLVSAGLVIGWAISTMTSVPLNASTSGGKSLNTAPSFTPAQQYGQVTSPSFESSSKRSTSGSNHPSPRNNQNQKKQHKNSRKPRLADEDAMAESVSHPLGFKD